MKLSFAGNVLSLYTGPKTKKHDDHHDDHDKEKKGEEKHADEHEVTKKEKKEKVASHKPGSEVKSSHKHEKEKEKKSHAQEIAKKDTHDQASPEKAKPSVHNKESKARIVVDNPEADIGNVIKGASEFLSYTFAFKNTGETDLIITKIKPG